MLVALRVCFRYKFVSYSEVVCLALVGAGWGYSKESCVRIHCVFPGNSSPFGGSSGKILGFGGTITGGKGDGRRKRKEEKREKREKEKGRKREGKNLSQLLFTNYHFMMRCSGDVILAAGRVLFHQRYLFFFFLRVDVLAGVLFFTPCLFVLAGWCS